MRETHARVQVLVADDAEDVAERVCRVLQDACDIEIVGPAPDGVEALRLYHATRPVAAVLDISMPRLDGIAVLRGIRAAGHPCKVIMLTTHTEPSIRDRCLAEGADHFLEKWSDFERVAEIVRAHVESGGS